MIKWHRTIIILMMSFFAASCTVDIPDNKAAVEINDITNKVNPSVLGQGTHKIGPFSTLVLYDISIKETDFKFEIMTRDVQSGFIQFTTKYLPKSENLPKIQQEYNMSIISDDYSLDIMIQQQIRSFIREFILDNYDKEELSNITIEDIKSKLISDKVTKDFVTIESIENVEIIFGEN